MEPKKNFAIPMPSTENGYVLVYVMVFILAVQAAALATVSIITFNMKSGNAFYGILNPQVTDQGQTLYTSSKHASPEGWDHAYFTTEILQKAFGEENRIFYRVGLREQPAKPLHDVSLAGHRPYLIVLIDDSESMNWSGGRDYKQDAVYLKKNTGEIIEVPEEIILDNELQTPSGTYFSGNYGNTHYIAPLATYYTGAMPSWPIVHSYLNTLLDELEMCDISIATISQGVIQPFTRDRELLLETLASIHPTSSESALAERLFKLVDEFPLECITDKHILLLTDGAALNDGNLPGWIQDFDHDNDPMDIQLTGIGSKCLDDVAAYAATLGIRVHTAGPEKSYLHRVAENGEGMFMPEATTFVPQEPFVCQMPVISQGGRLNLVNRLARFDPPWLDMQKASFYAIDASGQINPCAFFPIRGLATSHYVAGNTLYCATSRDYLLAIDIPSMSLMWMLKGCGGKILYRDNLLIAGPNNTGTIHVINAGPHITWNTKAGLFESTSSRVYTATDKKIIAFDLKYGSYLAEFSANHSITSLRYDPCTDFILAGTLSGIIYVLNPALDIEYVLATDQGQEVVDLHSFHWRKQLYILALTGTHITCTTPEGIAWSERITNGSITQAVVMDAKIHVTSRQTAHGCPG
ncbi:MAG: WD40 repeat domain-containing protein, partial [Deltaproteobacteria bacterium]|nr:WD40 repeat domain-containing protein [Deltaproteobacteria bacterium]